VVTAAGLTAARLACHRDAHTVCPTILNMPRTLSAVLLTTTMREHSTGHRRASLARRQHLDARNPATNHKR
jgi:hypothetical protein